MHDLRIRITESDGIRYAGKIEGDYAETLYIGENIPEALDAILEGLQSFRDIPAMVRALHFCPEFCQLAAAVHGLHLAESDETPTTEAIAILTKLRDSRQPEAIRTRAGNLLIDIAEDDRAVCDASSVDEGLEVIGATRTVWWEGVDVFSTPEATGKLYAVERDNRTCPLYRIRLDDGRATTGNQIKIPEVTP